MRLNARLQPLFALLLTSACAPHALPGAIRTAIGLTGNQGAIDANHFENLPGVAEVIRVTKPYKLISLELKNEKTIVRSGDATIGDG